MSMLPEGHGESDLSEKLKLGFRYGQTQVGESLKVIRRDARIITSEWAFHLKGRCKGHTADGAKLALNKNDGIGEPAKVLSVDLEINRRHPCAKGPRGHTEVFASKEGFGVVALSLGKVKRNMTDDALGSYLRSFRCQRDRTIVETAAGLALLLEGERDAEHQQDAHHPAQLSVCSVDGGHVEFDQD